MVLAVPSPSAHHNWWMWSEEKQEGVSHGETWKMQAAGSRGARSVAWWPSMRRQGLRASLATAQSRTFQRTAHQVS